MNCPRCKSTDIVKHGSIVAARGRVQRYDCRRCGKRFHPPLALQPIREREGYWDIECSQASRGAGVFGVIYGYYLLERSTGRLHGAWMRARTREEERRVVAKMCQDLRRVDRVYTWYGTGLDGPMSRTRAEHYRLDFPGYQEVLHTDLYYAFRGKFKLHSNRQDTAAAFFGQPPQAHHLSPSVWVDAMFDDTFKAAIRHIAAHCREDCHQTQHIHERIEKYLKGTGRTL